MRIIKQLFGSLLLLSLFSSCSNDVDIYADYKDISIVYGIMDSSDDTTWLKITKAFQGPGNALLFATNPDSSNYDYKLDVKMVGVKNGVEKQTIVFDTITIKNKHAGDSVFYYPNQIVYYSTEVLDVEYKYELVIIREDGEITSETKIVDDFYVTYPNRSIDFKNNNKEIEWNSAANGKRYEVSFKFNYKELLPGSSDTTIQSVSWNLAGAVRSSSLAGGENMYKAYSGDEFYSILENELEVILNVQRWAIDVDIIIPSATQDFDTYLEVNQGADNLLSEVPIYTNIDGGIGLFASRKTIVKSAALSAGSELKLVVEYPDLGFKPRN